MTAVPSALVIFRGNRLLAWCAQRRFRPGYRRQKAKNSASRPANIKKYRLTSGANVVQVRVLFIWCIHIVLSEDVGKDTAGKVAGCEGIQLQSLEGVAHGGIDIAWCA